MSYVEKNLMNGEKVIYQTRLHWIIFRGTFAYTLLAIILFSHSGKVDEELGFFFLALGIIVGFSALITFLTSEFAVTTHRVIVKVGFIRRASLEILLSKVEAVGVRQGILGRILNFGNIQITGSGGTKDPFRRIVAPLEFRKRAQEQISGVGSPTASPVNPVRTAPTL